LNLRNVEDLEYICKHWRYILIQTQRKEVGDFFIIVFESK